MVGTPDFRYISGVEMYVLCTGYIKCGVPCNNRVSHAKMIVYLTRQTLLMHGSLDIFTCTIPASYGKRLNVSYTSSVLS